MCVLYVSAYSITLQLNETQQKNYYLKELGSWSALFQVMPKFFIRYEVTQLVVK